MPFMILVTPDLDLYLTQAFLPRQKSSDIIVMLKWCHYVMSHLSVFSNYWEPFFKKKYI